MFVSNITRKRLTLYRAKAIIVLSRYTGRWCVSCYIWYSEEGPVWGRSPPRPVLAVPNVTAHPPTASVPITVLMYNDPLLCGFNVSIKGLKPLPWNFHSLLDPAVEFTGWGLLCLVLFLTSCFITSLAVSSRTAVWGRWQCGSGKYRSDKVWKAIRRKYMYSKVPDEIWLSWLSCPLVAKRSSQASQPVNVATEQHTGRHIKAVYSDSWCNLLCRRFREDAKWEPFRVSDADDDDDTEAPSYQLTQLSIDFCEVCLVAPRDTRIALVPCGHQRFCELRANEVHDQERGCPLYRTPINMLLRLY